MCFHIMKNEEAVWRSNDEEIKTCYQGQVTYCRRINISQLIATFCSCFCFTLVSLLQVLASEDMSEFKDKPFMHDMWYPFRRETHMPWVIFINIWIVLQGLCFNTMTQTTFIALMIYASARMKILQIRLRKFEQIAKEKYDGNVLYTVKDLIIEHQLLIRWVLYILHFL